MLKTNTVTLTAPGLHVIVQITQGAMTATIIDSYGINSSASLESARVLIRDLTAAGWKATSKTGSVRLPPCRPIA